MLGIWFGNQALGVFLPVQQWPLKDRGEGCPRRIKKARISCSVEKPWVSHAVATVCSSEEVER